MIANPAVRLAGIIIHRIPRSYRNILAPRITHGF